MEPMGNEQITLDRIYSELRNLEIALQNKGIISQKKLSENEETIWDWPEQITVLADEKLLGEDWLSQEDEIAWKDL